MSEQLNPSDSSAIESLPLEQSVKDQAPEVTPEPAMANAIPQPTPICGACGYETVEGFTREDVAFRECPACGGFTAFNPKPIVAPTPAEYLIRKELFDLHEQPVLIWGAQDGSFVKYLQDAGYKVSGYDARFPAMAKMPKGKFATVILCDVLNFSTVVSETLSAAKLALQPNGKIVVQNFYRSNRNIGQLSIAADIEVGLGATTILTNQGLALAAKRAGLNVVSQDFARAIILA